MHNELVLISLPGEEWRVVETKGMQWYVSNRGRIWVPGQLCQYKRVRKGVEQTLTHTRKSALLTPYDGGAGYLEVGRKTPGGKRIKARVHRLVAMAFCPGFGTDLTVNHIDGDKLNNLPENLEWVSLAENTRHQWGMGLAKGAEPRLTSKQVVYMRRLVRQGVPAHTIDIIAGVAPGYTSMLCKGHRRKTVQD